jgi:uncharacterized protein (TIGR02271 family)
MATSQRSTCVGVFEDHRQAQRAVEELKRVGFRDEQLGVVSHDTEARQAGGATKETGSYAGEGAAIGAAAGAGVGALWALGIAAGLLPGIGPVIAGGLLASLLASAAGGAAVAGIAGALIGLGIPEEEAAYYEGEFKGGRTLVTVRGDGRYEEACTILRRFGAYDRSTAPAARGATEAGKTVQLHEEHLHPHKEQVQTGEVRVHKEVTTEHKTLNVPVQREEVVIERHPVSGQACASDIKPGEEVRIPVKEEQVRVEKEAVVKEEVTVGKRKVQDTEQVSGTVRKEELRVEEEGKVDVRGKGPEGKERGRNPRGKK